MLSKVACNIPYFTAHRRPFGPNRFLILLIVCWALPFTASAGIHDVTVTDVTTHAFSVAWLSDDSVLDANVKVYADESGLDELTANLSVTLVSANVPEALDRGVVKVDVVGLEPDTTYYFALEMTTDAGVESYPAALPLPGVTTAVSVSKSRADTDEPIINDLVAHAIYDPDGTTPGSGALLLVKLPGVSPYPISAFVGDGIEAPMAMADLSNLFDDAGVSAEAPAGAVMEIKEFRGNICDAASHQLARLRRVAPHDEVPPITELEAPAACYAPDGVGADYDCDGRIGLVDFTRFLGNFTLQAPDCQFNSDYDLDSDGRVGLVDFTRFLSVFGSTEQAAP